MDAYKKNESGPCFLRTRCAVLAPKSPTNAQKAKLLIIDVCGLLCSSSSTSQWWQQSSTIPVSSILLQKIHLPGPNPAHLPVIYRFSLEAMIVWFRWIRAASKLCWKADLQDRIEQTWAIVLFQLLVSKYV